MIRERDFQNQVVRYARARAWLYYHTHDSRKSTPGFPDLTLVRGGRLIFAELKVGQRKATKAQRIWLDQLRSVEAVEAYLWYPSDWEHIEEVLS